MRYPVHARVTFRWRTEEGDQRNGEGTSRDISETGIFVLAPTCPPVGADVELEVLLEELSNATRAFQVRLTGQVLRVDQSTAGGGGSGFAVLDQRSFLRENDDSTGL